jgi:hypothetical protein
VGLANPRRLGGVGDRLLALAVIAVYCHFP